MIGNKSELEDSREVTFDRAVEFAKMNKIHKCFETSAKTGQNVEEVFSCACKEVQMKNDKKAEEEKSNSTPDRRPSGAKGLNNAGGRKSTAGGAAAASNNKKVKLGAK